MLFQIVVIQIITFIAIVFILRKLLYTETAREVERLKKLKEEHLQNKNKTQEKLEEAQRLYQEKIAQAKEEARQMRMKAEEENESLKKSIIDKAKDESEQIVKAAFNVKEKIREEVYLEMREKAPVLAGQIFKEIISETVKDTAHGELVKEVIDYIKKIDKSKFNEKLKKGELISAKILDKDEKDKIISNICDKLGYEIEVREKQDSNILAGVVITVGTLVIDGSLLNRMKQIEERLRRAE